MKSETLVNAVLVVLTVCAITVTGFVVRRELTASSGLRPDRPHPERIDGWKAYAAAGHRLGRTDAPVTIVEFSDYQCPFCRELHGRLESFRRAHPSDVAVVHRQYPLTGHPHARPAALATECAAEQGRFSEMQGTLYAHQDSLGSTPWREFAARAGVQDLPRFEGCMGAGRYDAIIERDLEAGKELGIQATPTLLINDLKVEGAVTDDALASLVEKARRRG